MKKLVYIILVLIITCITLYKSCHSKTKDEKTPKPEIIVESKKNSKDGNKIKFVDKNKKIVKEIDLSYKSEKIDSKDAGFTKYKNKINKGIFKNAWPAKSGDYVAVGIQENYDLIPNSENEKKTIEGTDASYIESRGVLQLYDKSGVMLWEKRFPKNRIVGKVYISDNGETIACNITCGMECDFGETGDEFGASSYIAYILNKQGKVLLIYPEKQSNALVQRLSLSPNGKYLAIDLSISIIKNSRSYISYYTLYYDLNRNKSWKKEGRYLSYLFDNGMADLLDVKTQKITHIDLKKHLGE